MLRYTAAMAIVEPINDDQAALVKSATYACIERGEQIFRRRFERIPVLFDLKGRASGMYRVRGREAVIRYNPWIFGKYFDDNLANTVPHEVAHYLVDRVYGMRRTRPHGREWRALMDAFDVRPERTNNYDLAGIPLRQSQQFSYRCDCQLHSLGPVRHRRIHQGRTRYHCRSCGGQLRYAG